MATILVGNIGEFDPDKEEWSQYATRLRYFFVANGIKEEATQKAIFLTLVGPATFKTLRSLVSPASVDDSTYPQLTGELEEYYNPKPSEIEQRFKFNSRCRQPMESVATFVTELRALAKHCNYAAGSLDSLLRDRLVCGINDMQMQRRLLSEKEITFKTALEIALAMETAARDTHTCSTLQHQQPDAKEENLKVTVPKIMPAPVCTPDNIEHPSGGYEHEFVNEIPECLCCGECKRPFCRPQLLRCCDRIICKPCIDHVHFQGKPCPYCKQPFSTVLDKDTRSRVLNLAVYCTNKENGCTWNGELRGLQDHISKSCEFVKQYCRYYCGEKFNCIELIPHERFICPNRPLDVKIEILESQFAECQVKIAQLEAQLVCPPCKLTMNGYTYHKSSKDEWFSPPFYDRPGGYKFCLKVGVNGTGSHVSVYVYLMKGLNDDRLVWPFQGSIEIQLVNQKKHNKSVVIEFDKKAASRGRADRAVMEDTSDLGCGLNQFVSHHRVEKVTDRSQYITDDCLTFIIADINCTATNFAAK